MFEDGERIRSRIHDALGVEQPHPSLRSRVIASMPVDRDDVRPRWQWAMGAVAIALTLTLVGSLVYIRTAGQRQGVPAGRVVGSVSIVTRLDFTCTLPVLADQSAATIRLPDGQATVYQAPNGGGKGTGGTGISYARGRWLPVPPQWLAPDGRSYAYATNTIGVPGQASTSAVFVHDVASGRDRQVWSGSGSTQMIAWSGDAVYVNRQIQDPVGPGEIWAVDPAAGGARRVGPNPPGTDRTAPGFIAARFGGGGAWSVVASQPQGAGAVGSGPNQVRRMDLRDGTVSTWFTAPAGRVVAIIGMDAQGHPVLALGNQVHPQIGPSPTPDPASAYPPPPSLLLLSGPDQVVVLADGSNSALRPSVAFGDGHGIWFDSPGALWLYRRGELIQVAAVPSRLFPQTTPPAGKGGVSSPPPNYPTGPNLMIEGGCQ
jgi:hypothetical protein